MRRFFAALAFGALAALAACQLVVGLERPRDDAPATEGGSEADGSAGDAGAPDASPAFLCLSAFAPMPPKSADAPDPVRAYVLATRGFAFRNQAGAMPAVDMDCIDTRCEGGDTSPSSCKPAGGPLPICDEPGGIDNQGGHSLLANFIFNSAKPVGSAEIARGLYGELIWLFNYNGLADDPAVRVAFVPSPGFDAYEPLQCVSGVFDLIDAGYTGDGGDGGDAGYEQYVGDASVPRWNGCDRWHVDAKYAASVSPFTSLNGYVRDSVLYVPPVEGATLPLTLGVSIATFQTPGIIAPLERFAFDGAPITDGGAASFVRIRQGKAFGRATTREILDFISRYRDNSGTCISRDGFQFAQTQLCGSEDLPSTSARVDQVCDAISFAVFFDGDPALHGEQREAGTAERCVSDRSAAELMDGSFLDCPQK